MRYLSVAALAATMVLSVSAALGGTIRGTVTSELGYPIAGAAVQMKLRRNDAATSTSTPVFTDGEGAFQFEDVPAGTYNVLSEKQAWTPSTRTIVMVDGPAVVELDIVLEQTLLYRVFANIRLGSLSYVVVFGLLILVANYFIAPRPVAGVDVFGWCVVLLGLVIAWVKLFVTQSVIISVFGLLSGLLIQRFGRQVADRRIREEDRQKQHENAAIDDERRSIEALVGKAGVTITDLKAFGTIDVEGSIISARALRGYISQNTKIVVRTIEGRTPVVEPHGSTVDS